MPKKEKVAVVEELQGRLSDGRAVMLTDYRGLNVREVTELREQLRQAGADYRVVKNTLARLAARAAELPEGFDEWLEGPTAIAFSGEDAVGTAKVLRDFANDHDSLQIKGGVLEGRLLATDEVEALASLPPREVLLGQFLRGMQGPLSGLVGVLHGTMRQMVYVLEALRQQKEAAA